MITLYWVYDIPNWLFAFLCIGVFVAFGLLGLTLTRRFVRRVHREDHSHNDVVGFYLAAVTVFYGITLGLVAVGT
jgi:nitrate reductase gamma subunit